MGIGQTECLSHLDDPILPHRLVRQVGGARGFNAGAIVLTGRFPAADTIQPVGQVANGSIAGFLHGNFGWSLV